MSRQYHTLIVKSDGKWFPKFGDYDREYMLDASCTYPDEACTRVITSGDSQPEIDAVILALNVIEAENVIVTLRQSILG